MDARYPGQVRGHKLCEPKFGYVHMSPFGTVYCFGPRRWSLCLEVDTGPPMTYPVGSESEWPGECHGQ